MEKDNEIIVEEIQIQEDIKKDVGTLSNPLSVEIHNESEQNLQIERRGSELVDTKYPPEIPKEIDEKSYSGEIRGLLNNYPREINVVSSNSIYNLSSNYISIYDLLLYCRTKTTKEEIRKKINEDIESFRKININELRELLIKFSSRSIFKSLIEKKLLLILNPNLDLLMEKTQFFYNCIPIKGKPYQHLRTVQGFPAASAESYEEVEIEEGKKIKEGQAFKIGSEGEIIPIE